MSSNDRNTLFATSSARIGAGLAVPRAHSVEKKSTQARSLVLVAIDDNPRSLELLASALARPELEILTATDPTEGLEMVFKRHPQIVVTDLVMPGMSGMEVLERVVEFDPSIDVIVMTAHYSTESAVEAIKRGACDYLNKPVPIGALRERVERLLEDSNQRARAFELENELLEQSTFEGIIGRSPQMWDMFSRVRRIAPHYQSVLITGETGTGKDLVARALHRLSPVASGNFVVLNCSAVVETLFESELFGHVKGAFTGADRDKVGLFEHANGGTLFLDEIGDMPLATQAKMLRALQNHEILRVGSLVPRKINVRVIAATNADLRAAIAEKRFREDLYYRFSMVEIHVPTLLDRKEDLPLLLRHFIAKYATQYAKKVTGVSRRAQIVLSRYHWPGNVRELENVLGHSCMMANGETIDVADLPDYVKGSNRPAAAASDDVFSAPPGEGAYNTIEEHERLLIVKAFEQAGNNQSQAARILRIGRDALRYKLKKYRIAF
jgi:DNA-binding NtrC family response regulator